MAQTTLWESGRAALNGWLSVPDSFVAEIMARQSWDSLTIDMQHGLVDHAGMLRLLTAITASPIYPIVRVPWLDPATIMAALDGGALGIIAPMINSAEEARQFVSYLRYAPKGGRSYGPIRAALVHGADYLAKADDLVTGFAMIETKEAVDRLEEILAVPGLNAIYIGPSDLAITLGIPPNIDPSDARLMEVIAHVLAAAKRHGVRAGIHNGSPAQALKMAAMGFDFVTVGSDAAFIAKGAAEAVGAYRAG